MTNPPAKKKQPLKKLAPSAEVNREVTKQQATAARRRQPGAGRSDLPAAKHEQHLPAETLAEVTMALTSPSNLAVVLKEILHQAQRLVPYQTAHIVLLEGDYLRIAAWHGYRASGSEEMISRLSQSLADLPLDAEVIRSRQPLLIPDTRQELRWQVHADTAWIRANLMLPISLGERVLGLLRLDADTPQAFSKEDIIRLQPLANIAAIALENARLYDQARQEISERKRAEEALQNSLEQLRMAYKQATIYAQELNEEIGGRRRAEGEIRRRNRELTLLNRAISISVTSMELAAVLEIACHELALAFEASRATATLLNQEKTAGQVVAEHLAEGQPSLLHQTLSVTGNPILQHLLTHQAPLLVNDIQGDPRMIPLRDLLGQRGTVSLLVLPLMIEGNLEGSLELEAFQPGHFSAEEMSLAWSVADQVGGVLTRARLNKERRQLSTAIEQTAESVIITDTEGHIVYVNPAFERITGYSRVEAIGQNMVDLLKSGKQEAGFYEEMWVTLKAQRVWQGRLINKKKSGALYTEEATISPVRGEEGTIVNYVAVKHDVTRELQLEEQYRQAQKMEAVGRLAGGIAHDFNNLLTVMIGFAELTQSQLPSDHPTQELVEIILDSGQHAADLVRQLLAFSRQQVIEPKILDLNAIVMNMDKMLGRLIGEDIELKTSLAPNLWPVYVDPTQLEQVIVNLVINARDAMLGGGQLIIETTNVVFSEGYTVDHLASRPGEHVLLAVSDTGIGMSEEVKAHIFEPFFTTKEAGKGTGLGLATVFGIVEQNGGHIWVYSEPGHGTTFKIYLPRAKETVTSPTQPRRQPDRLLRGTETVLLVEDEPGVRDLAVRLLRRQGYTVLAAANGQEALRVGQEYAGEIHLLLSDMVMPQMSGPVLADQFRAVRPHVKLLFTSGYTDKAIVHQQVLEPGVAFLQKPFSVEELTRKVRAVLDG